MKRGRKKNCARCGRRTCSLVQRTVGRDRARDRAAGRPGRAPVVVPWRGVASLSSIPRRPQRRSMSRGSPKATARGGVNPAARGCCHLPVMPSRSRLALASRPVYTPPTPRRTLLSPAMLASGREAHAVRQSAPRRPAPYLFLPRVRSGRPAATVTCSGCTDRPPIDRLDRWYSLARAATRG
jgi:hypothetical protein